MLGLGGVKGRRVSPKNWERVQFFKGTTVRRFSPGLRGSMSQAGGIWASKYWASSP